MKTKIICAVLAALSAGCMQKSVDQSSAPASTNGVGGEQEKIKIVRLFYATDRKPTEQTDAKAFYGASRISAADPLNYGICHVTIPPEHEFARLEEYKWWRLESRNVPDRHVTLLDLRQRTEKGFFDELRQSIGSAEDKEVFVFIHGYNVSWEDSARRAGQIAYDIGLTPPRGVPLLYSWASQGALSDYLVDDNNVKTAAQRLRGVLTNIVAQAGARRINILAHSMGNQALDMALELIGTAMLPTATPAFDQVVMAAPDLDVTYLEQSAEALRRTAKHFTIYSCRTDLPVKVSTWLRGKQARVGSFALLEGFDTIDATKVQVDTFLHHSYVGDAPPVLRDLQKLVHYGCPVSSRCCCCFKQLTDSEAKKQYWAFQDTIPTNCTHLAACR